MDRECRVVDCGEAGGEPGPAGVVAILIPPPILDEVQVVLDTPVVPHVSQQVFRRNAAWVEAGDEVADVVRDELAGGGADLAIDADR